MNDKTRPKKLPVLRVHFEALTFFRTNSNCHVYARRRRRQKTDRLRNTAGTGTCIWNSMGYTVWWICFLILFLQFSTGMCKQIFFISKNLRWRCPTRRLFLTDEGREEDSVARERTVSLTQPSRVFVVIVIVVLTLCVQFFLGIHVLPLPAVFCELFSVAQPAARLVSS